jgi:hypothetical protein
MRVKLSYSVDADEVRPEAAFLLANLGPKLTEAIALFNSIINNLREEEFDDESFTTEVDKLRRSLALVDLRLSEVEQISLGYAEYQEHGGDLDTLQPEVEAPEREEE